MNIVDNCLDKYSGTATDLKIAIRWEGEDGETKCIGIGNCARR